MKNILFLLAGGLLLVSGYLLSDYLGFTARQDLTPGRQHVVNEPVREEPHPEAEETEEEIPAEVAYRVESFVEDLYVPWSMVFTSSERMLVTERNGSLRVVRDGQLVDEPLKVFPEVSSQGEEGLMGLTLHPDYEQNSYLYVSYAYPKDDQLVVKVVRLKDEGDVLSEETTIIDDIPAARFHAGSRIKFGPDGKLYITTGDASTKELAQETDSLAGKILRLNDDGTIPDDNPFGDSPLFTIGHRNPQGIDWHPPSDTFYSTEHGPSVFDGPAGGDEVNVIVAGENYGWPRVSHEENEPGLVAPKLVFTPAVAPASGIFYEGDVFPQFRNNFFFGLLRGEGIMRVVISEDDPREVVLYERLEGIDVGRVRTVAEGPDGLIYFSTSNQDGRGTLRPGDDKIYRLVPETR